jgi:hypothetical protein
MESFTEIAVLMATMIAHAHGCELESFSVDDIDTYTDETGEHITRVRVSATLGAAHDEIPFDITPRPKPAVTEPPPGVIVGA